MPHASEQTERLGGGIRANLGSKRAHAHKLSASRSYPGGEAAYSCQTAAVRRAYLSSTAIWTASAVTSRACSTRPPL